jgi:hypothetical protein
MSLQFPNSSRSYDASHDRVRFWAHDGALEVPFFVECEALRAIAAGSLRDEAELLGAFDALGARIQAAAVRLYAPRTRSSYTLRAMDF